MFAPEEAALWRREGEAWVRQGPVPTRLRTGESKIEGARQGLFATEDMDDGTRLGRIYGIVVATGSLDEVEDIGIRREDTRSFALRHEGEWALVHTEGAFGFLNHAAADPTAYVSEAGWVEVCRDVRMGEEVTIDYGELFGFTNSMDDSDDAPPPPAPSCSRRQS